MSLRLAWRNIWRQRRRTLLTLSAIAFATFFLVFMLAVQYSTYAIAIENTLRVFPGVLQVQHSDYAEKQRMEDTVANSGERMGEVEEALGIESITQRAHGRGMVSSDTRSRGVEMVGVEPEREGRVSTLPNLMTEGRYIREGTEAVLGESLATRLQVEPGDELVFMGQGRHGSMAVTTLKVVGLFHSGEPELDQSLVQMPVTSFQNTFNLQGEAHALVLGDIELGDLPEATTTLRSLLADEPDLRVLEWEELVPGLDQTIALDQAGAWIMYVVLVVVVVLSILTAFLMSVMERTREFGVMMALGMTHRRITRLIFTETMLLVLIGVLVGLGLGVAAIEYFRTAGLPVPGGELASEFHLPSEIHPRLTVLSAVVGPAIVLVLTLLAALYPISRVRRMQPVDAMKAV